MTDVEGPRFEPDAADLPSVVLSQVDDPSKWTGDLLAVCVTEDDFKEQDNGLVVASSALSALDQNCQGAVSDVLLSRTFTGKKGQSSHPVRLPPGSSPRHLVLLGLGKHSALQPGAVAWGENGYKAAGCALAAVAKAHKYTKLGVTFVTAATAPSSGISEDAVKSVIIGILSDEFEGIRFRGKQSRAKSSSWHVTSIELLHTGWSDWPSPRFLPDTVAVAQGVLLSRYLIEAPANVCTPTYLAHAAEHIAAISPDVMSLKVLEREQCQALGMGLFLGVAQGSDEPPKFIHLTYTPKEAVKRKVAVVGKGLTFDSGGYNLKVHGGIELMKFDMGGAAAMLGAARIIAGIQPPGVEIHFITASCENMINGHATRPGDIHTSANGKTVEIDNTDAEGRLTLADALWYAQEKCGVSAVVDIATLTGACIIALGPGIAGLWSDDDGAAESVLTASKAAGEKFWRMPLEADYSEQLKSSSADLKNYGGRYGGAITAALFLKEFINPGVAWVHLDVAGPVWDEKIKLPTGYGAQTLAEWVAAQGRLNN
eukprot:jgi/Chrzof1/14512/Cz09g05170.t1